jgi:prepilin-type N-terminal cleavage/methylation domain-containing protein
LPGSASRPRRGVERRGASAFTLIELLVVMSILLLVAVVALPSVSHLSKAAARRAAVTQSMGILDQARAIALSQGNTVYVVFANGDAAIPEAYRYRSYAVFREVYYPEHRNYVPSDSKTGRAEPYLIELVRPWTKLPDGVAFKPAGSTSSVFDGPTAKFPFRIAQHGGTTQEQQVTVPYLRFSAMGLLEQQGGEPWIAGLARVRLFEGFVDASGTAVMTNAGRQDAEEMVVLSPVTGRAHREEAKSAG